MSPADRPASASPASSDAREQRFCLRDMLQEVAEERQTGAFGNEKVHPRDIRKIFRAKPRKSRAAPG